MGGVVLKRNSSNFNLMSFYTGDVSYQAPDEVAGLVFL